MRKIIQAVAVIMALLPSATLAQDSTPLHTAAESGDAETVAALINAGAYVGASDGFGDTPFDLAKEHNQENLEGTNVWWRLLDGQ